VVSVVTAQATVVPPASSATVGNLSVALDTYMELYTPFINPAHPVCLDVPGGNANQGVHYELFHCHESVANGGPQLFKFYRFARFNDKGFRIQNKSTGMCLHLPGLPEVIQDLCDSESESLQWIAVPAPTGPAGSFFVETFFGGSCLTASNLTGANKTRVVSAPCATDDPRQIWATGWPT
jgi:hypothetical protein